VTAVTAMARGVAVLGLSLAAMAAAAGPSLAAEPIKIGLVHPFTGPLSPVGIEATNGFELYFDLHGKTVAGREIAIVKEDSAGIPAQAMERVRRLVERDRVDVLTGITSSANAYAIRDYVVGHQVPLVIMGNAGANALTDKRGSPYIFRTSFSNYQDNAPFGSYACTNLGYKKVAVMFSDFVTGYEMSSAFEGSYKKAGCEVVTEIKAPLGNSDFAPFLSQVPASKINAVWAMFFGADAIAYVKQYQSFGLKDKLPLIGTGSFEDQTLIDAMGDTAEGITGAAGYGPDLDNAVNKAFVKAYTAKYHVLPAGTQVSGWNAAEAIVRAVAAVDGKTENKEAFLAALRKVRFASPEGEFRFDAKQNTVHDMYLLRNVRKDGKITPHVVTKIATAVDQFWQPK
jgi:branched-chain amino acid transport system substrate-binding protein